MTTHILKFHVVKIDFIIWKRHDGILYYTSTKARYQHKSSVS